MNHSTSFGLGQLRSLAILGEGGMARVILCARQGLANIQKLLVIKEIRDELATDADFVAMFIDEARLATRMSHPNVVHTFDVGAEGDRYYMVMEYLDGQPMSALLGRTKRQVPLATHLRILVGVLSGLHYAHELRDFDGKPMAVVHRDVSPQNTFICYDGQVKLVDFGIAKAAGAVTRTTAGVFKGKFGYVAPEQVTGADIDRRADIFSVGVMLWEALVGRKLSYRETEASILHKRTMGTQPRVLEARPDADPEFAAICDRAMALDPNDRFASAEEMRDALSARIEALSLRASDADIGKLVTDSFAEERKRIRAIIERQLALPARVNAADSSAEALPLLPTTPESVPPSARGGSEPSLATVSPAALPNASRSRISVIPDGTNTSGSTSMPTVAPTKRGRSRRLAMLLAGASIVILGSIKVVTAARNSDAKRVETVNVPKPAASGVETSAQAPEGPSDTNEAPSTVDVAVYVSTPGAVISVDGEDVGKSPYRALVPHDDREHRIVVSADHYYSESRTIRFDRDLRLEIALKPQASDWRGETRIGRGSSAIPSAGADIQVAKPKRSIDEKDPY